MKVIIESIIWGVTALPLKRNLVPRFKKRGAARKQGTDMMKCFTGKIESQDDWNENSQSPK
jgi:hypothetical protein